MMFADLVDLEDLRRGLLGLGVALPPGGSPEQLAAAVRAALPVEGLDDLLAALGADGVTPHPDVRRAVALIRMT
ncbi:MAG: hypothetical protein KDG52_18435 [Rhodocyclaceae bacterium]|nr:hypothetical protein [Rhodocyclaceae bacterium]